MSLFENAIISLTKYKLSHALNLDDIKEISSDGLKQYRDIPYKNRSGKELLMDIFEPITDVKEDLPVIVNIHGGGLIDGDKKFSVGHFSSGFQNIQDAVWRVCKINNNIFSKKIYHIKSPLNRIYKV